MTKSGDKMKIALNNDDLKFTYQCPDCKWLVSGLTVTHPWRLYCSRCKQELQNPDHPEYYPPKSGDKFLKELADKALKAERLGKQVEALLRNEPETLQEWVEQEKN